MNVAVIDVGSNTIRLLVATAGSAGLQVVAERKAHVGLGAEVERHGEIRRRKVQEAAACTEAFAREARALGCKRVEVVLASPGRQASNAGRLVRWLAQAARAPVRILTQEEEARLAFDGALANVTAQPGLVAVCDIGGGSTQVAVGTAAGGPVWIKSVDLGSLRLTTRMKPSDPPTKAQFARAQEEAGRAFDGLAAPLARDAYVVGGTARALRKIVGGALGATELESAFRLLRKLSSGDLSRKFGIEPPRAATLPGGIVILAEVQRRFGVPLWVAGGGLREGLVQSLLSQASAA